MLKGIDKRAVAAGVIVVWAAVLMQDMRSLKSRDEFKRTGLGGGGMRLFGVRLDGGDDQADGKQ